jgi:rubredoxin
MTKFKCKICGWIYDSEVGMPRNGIEPGTKFLDLPDNFRCPKCGAQKKWFIEIPE